MSRDIKFITGNKKFLEELQANLFSMVSQEGHELGGSDVDGYMLKIDESMFNDGELRLIECAIKSRISSGVFEADYEIREELVKNSFSLTADSQEKLEIIQNDILRGAKVPAQNICILQQPFGPGMYNTLKVVVIAVGLNEDQMKAVHLASKTAATGIKVTAFTKKASMVVTSTANVTNRVAREVALAGTEVGATVLAGTVKTGVEVVACAANIAIRDLNPHELFKGDNVQTLAATVKGLWKRDKGADKITNGFAAL